MEIKIMNAHCKAKSQKCLPRTSLPLRRSWDHRFGSLTIHLKLLVVMSVEVKRISSLRMLNKLDDVLGMLSSPVLEEWGGDSIPWRSPSTGQRHCLAIVSALQHHFCPKVICGPATSTIFWRIYRTYQFSPWISMDLLSVCCASTWAAKEMRTCRSALSVGESCARSHQNGPTQTCGINSMSCTKQDWWFFNKNRLVALSAKFCKICSQIFIQIHARLKRVISIAVRLSSFNLIIVFVLFCTIYIYIHIIIYTHI